jgi:endonuclease/exonuclease/phosphatase family metal-dependent hydrolase
MRIATWNIYWLGDRTGEHVVRSPEDEKVIAQVIARLAPDVLALQEIVDPLVMERILGMAGGPGREYVLRTGEAWLTSDPDPLAEENRQKAFLCINRETVEFQHGAVIHGGPKKYVRQPYAATLRHRASGHEFVAVAVHLRAGYPVFLDESDARVRKREATALAKWLQGKKAAQDKNPDFPRPEHGDRVVLGDFNAQLQDPNQSLDPLALPGWTWHNPEPDGDHWETAIFENDRYVIDLMLLSPEMAARVPSPPAIFAWDHDPALGGPAHFHLGPDGSGNLRHYRVSDHRPVWVEVEV